MAGATITPLIAAGEADFMFHGWVRDLPGSWWPVCSDEYESESWRKLKEKTSIMMGGCISLVVLPEGMKPVGVPKEVPPVETVEPTE
jgi:hypothetical protein